MNNVCQALLKLKLPQPADLSSLISYVEARQDIIQHLQADTNMMTTPLSDLQLVQVQKLGVQAMLEAQRLQKKLLRELQEVQIHRQRYHERKLPSCRNVQA